MQRSERVVSVRSGVSHFAHGMADYMRAVIWDRAGAQNSAHGPKPRTFPRLRNENLALAVPGLGHLVSDLGLVSKFGGRQRANSLVGGSSPSSNSVRIHVVACRIFQLKLPHTWRLIKPFSSNS